MNQKKTQILSNKSPKKVKISIISVNFINFPYQKREKKDEKSRQH